MTMLDGAKVSNRQVALLLATTTVIATAVLFVPAITAVAAGQNGWISLLVTATVYGLLVALVIVRLGRRFPGLTLVEYAQRILGPFLGKMLGAAYLFWFIHVNAVVIREFGDFLDTAFMPETPVMAFHIVLLVLAAQGTRYGLETICRANEFVFYLLMISLAIIAALALPDADFSNLLPVLDQGIRPVLEGGLAPSGFRGEIVVLAMILPNVDRPGKTGLYLALAVLLLGVLLALATVLTTAVLGGLAGYLTFPTFELARYISLGRFLERMEALILVMWVSGVTIKVAVFYYAGALAAAQVFGIRDWRPVILPLGLVLAALSHSLFGNTREMVNWISTVWPPYAYTFELVIPALLLLVAALRGKGGSKNGG